MSQHSRTERHKEAHPCDEKTRKERQRQRELVMHFHITRNHLYGYGFPESLDQSSDMFERVRSQYLSKLSQPVEVVTS